VAAGTKEVMFNVFEGLVKVSSDGDLIPAVAENYTISPDGLTYTFTIREGITFHNGDAVAAEDVVYSIERCAAASETGIVQVAALSAIQTMETPDERTVVITLAEPNNEFLVYLTLAVLPADYTEQDTKPVGTGPFKFVSRSAQESIVMEKFEGYWGTPANLDKVTLKVIPDQQTMVMSLRSGAIDLADKLPATQIAELSDLTIVQGSSNIVQALYLNNAFEPFTDVRVRQALCYAIDKDMVIDLASNGDGIAVGSSMYPAFGKYFMDELTYYYQPNAEKAKELLKEAGYESLSFTITVPSNYTAHVDAAQVMVEQLRTAGINAKIELVEWATWLEEVYRGRNFEATVSGLDAHGLAASDMVARLQSASSKNFVNFNSAAYDEAYAKAMSTTDETEQTALFKECETILTAEAANVYIQDAAIFAVMQNDVAGYEHYPLYVMDLASVYKIG
jgi:peptide/nickel transport system substrate-binding protein